MHLQGRRSPISPWEAGWERSFGPGALPMDPGQLPTFDPCCEFGFSTQISETVYRGLEGAKEASRGGGWGEPFLLRLPEAQGPSRLAAEESALHDPSPTCLSRRPRRRQARQTLTNSKMKSRSGKVVKTAKPLGRLLTPDAAEGAMLAGWRRPRNRTGRALL